jgi:hypothetical protein
MSDTGHPPPAPPPVPPPPRSGCLTALMVLMGVILLLPGLCTLAFFPDQGIAVTISFIVISGGILLIWLALRGPRR